MLPPRKIFGLLRSACPVSSAFWNGVFVLDKFANLISWLLMKKHQRMKVQRGFSLIEVIVVLAIMMIITVIAIPIVRQTVAGYQLDASALVVDSLLPNTSQAPHKPHPPHYT